MILVGVVLAYSSVTGHGVWGVKGDRNDIFGIENDP